MPKVHMVKIYHIGFWNNRFWNRAVQCSSQLLNCSQALRRAECPTARHQVTAKLKSPFSAWYFGLHSEHIRNSLHNRKGTEDTRHRPRTPCRLWLSNFHLGLTGGSSWLEESYVCRAVQNGQLDINERRKIATLKAPLWPSSGDKSSPRKQRLKHYYQLIYLVREISRQG